MSLANDGLYREARHFTAWPKKMQTETYYLEDVIEKVTGQHTVPIGDAILSTRDTAIGCVTCEEMFTPSNPSTVCIPLVYIRGVCTFAYRLTVHVPQRLRGHFECRLWKNLCLDALIYPFRPHSDQLKQSSASHAELRKLKTRLDLIANST